MTDLNSVVLIGRLTRDMETKYLPSGACVGNFAVAVNRSVKKGDEWSDETSFFDVTLFGKMAESLKVHLVKGKQVAINGSLKQDRWTKDGQNYSRIGVVADTVQLLGSRDNAGASDGGNGRNKIAPNKPQNNNADVTNGDEEYPEDIPF